MTTKTENHLVQTLQSCMDHCMKLWKMFAQLQNSFPEELKTTKHKIKHTNVTEDLFTKKKWYKIIIFITITESTENVYYVTRQNLHFAHSPYYKNKNLKRKLKSYMMIKRFDSEMIFFGLDWEVISYGQKRIIMAKKIHKHLCKVNTV